MWTDSGMFRDEISLARVRGGDSGAAQTPRAVGAPLSGRGLSFSVKNAERRRYRS